MNIHVLAKFALHLVAGQDVSNDEGSDPEQHRKRKKVTITMSVHYNKWL